MIDWSVNPRCVPHTVRWRMFDSNAQFGLRHRPQVSSVQDTMSSLYTGRLIGCPRMHMIMDYDNPIYWIVQSPISYVYIYIFIYIYKYIYIYLYIFINIYIYIFIYIYLWIYIYIYSYIYSYIYIVNIYIYIHMYIVIYIYIDTCMCTVYTYMYIEPSTHQFYWLNPYYNTTILVD